MSPVCTPRCSAGDAPGLYRQRTPLPPPALSLITNMLAYFQIFTRGKQTSYMHPYVGEPAILH